MTRSAFALLILLVAAGPARAQINTLAEDNPRETARLKIGPFYVTPGIELTDFGIDTNVFNAAGERRKDFTVTVAPRADVWVPVARRGLLKATVGSDLVWYQEFASERSVDPSVMGRGELYLRRFTVFAEDTLVHSRQRPTFEIDVRSRRLENRFMAGVDVRLTPKISVEIHGTTATTEFEGDSGLNLREKLNRTSKGFGTIARYRMSVLTSFALRAERFEERFPLAPERGADNVRVMPGVELRPRALISGHAYVGVRHLNPVDESLLPEFSGLVSDLALSYTFMGATTVGLTHTRDVRYSFEVAQPYYVDTGVGVQVRRALGSRFDIIVSGQRHAYSYRTLLGTGGAVEPERVDTIWSYSGSVGYRLGRTGRVGLGVDYWRRGSARPGRDYDRLRIGTTASYGF